MSQPIPLDDFEFFRDDWNRIDHAADPLRVFAQAGAFTRVDDAEAQRAAGSAHLRSSARLRR